MTIRMLTSGLAGAVLFCASAATAYAADFTLKVSYLVNTASPLHRTFEEFKTTVEEASGGKLEVRLFPSGQLAGAGESIEGAQSGSIEIVATTAGVLAGFVPDWALLDIPFQFKDAAHARDFLDTTGNDLLYPKMETYGLVGLATWNRASAMSAPRGTRSPPWPM